MSFCLSFSMSILRLSMIHSIREFKISVLYVCILFSIMYLLICLARLRYFCVCCVHHMLYIATIHDWCNSQSSFCNCGQSLVRVILFIIITTFFIIACRKIISEINMIIPLHVWISCPMTKLVLDWMLWKIH